METNNKSTKIYKARIIGILFLVAFLAYGIGRSLLESANASAKYSGAILVLLNSLMVLLIGVYIRKTLQPVNCWVGNIYLFSRAFESMVLAGIIFNVLPGVQVPDFYSYYPAMIVLGLGSIPMCYALYKYKISPSWLGIWGIIGYSTFTFGFIVELLGKNWSMYFLPPGALWEVTFAVWLIIKGQQMNHLNK